MFEIEAKTIYQLFIFILPASIKTYREKVSNRWSLKLEHRIYSFTNFKFLFENRILSNTIVVIAQTELSYDFTYEANPSEIRRGQCISCDYQKEMHIVRELRGKVQIGKRMRPAYIRRDSLLLLGRTGQVRVVRR